MINHENFNNWENKRFSGITDMQIVQSLQILIETISICFTFAVSLHVTWAIEVTVETIKFLGLKEKHNFNSYSKTCASKISKLSELLSVIIFISFLFICLINIYLIIHLLSYPIVFSIFIF